ncbi:hypothetical protein A3K63_02165 [Candidatus Micrarchaeota archaeon RBG_16_49_10]|nr:MAG: hypothetical protein A3K63_02165 [Candidatus Micrarchaeota archaeon RBG_16_49_10]
MADLKLAIEETTFLGVIGYILNQEHNPGHYQIWTHTGKKFEGSLEVLNVEGTNHLFMGEFNEGIGYTGILPVNENVFKWFSHLQYLGPLRDGRYEISEDLF